MDKPVLFVVSSRFPYPLEKGDKLRLYYQIKSLSKHFTIHLVSTSHIQISASDREQLLPYCSSVEIIRIHIWQAIWNVILAFVKNDPLQVGYFFSHKGRTEMKRLIRDKKPDYIYCQLIRTTEWVKDYHDCPKTLDYMDVLSVGMERRSRKEPWFKKWIFKMEANRLKRYERTVFEYFEKKSIISEQDQMLIPHPGKKNISIIPNGISTDFFSFDAAPPTYDLVFVGNLSYAPNEEAVRFIHEKLLPLKKDLHCLISGANPSSYVKKVCARNSSLHLTGWVDDIRTSYGQGKIFVAPMLTGTGMQNKLLEAMAMGIPCITTSLANNAIQAPEEEAILVAETPQEFVNGINRLLGDTILYQKLSANGRHFVRQHYSWESSNQKLIELILSSRDAASDKIG